MTRLSETRRFDRLLIMALSLCAACYAPRNNPFDPQNPRSLYVALEGHVQTQSLPRTALTGAAMFWKNGNRLVQTDKQGHFRFENLLPANDWLHIEKSGYKKDSVFVFWEGNKRIALDIFLNAMPMMENLQLSTEILHQYFSNQEARLAVKAGISDRDNDVDTVFVKSEKFGLRKALDYDVDDKSYVAALKLFDLKVNNLEELIGEDFLIVVKDLAADEIVVGKSGIKRVIQDEIEFESPAGDQVVPPTPTFIWKRFQPGFPFTFTLELRNPICNRSATQPTVIVVFIRNRAATASFSGVPFGPAECSAPVRRRNASALIRYARSLPLIESTCSEGGPAKHAKYAKSLSEKSDGSCFSDRL